MLIKSALALFLLANFACAAQGNTSGVMRGTITAVVDGDTVKVRFEGNIPPGCKKTETVRLIGVDTPELTTDPPQFFAVEARDFTNQFWKSPVTLEFDQVSERRDKYGRLLAYVYVSGHSVPLNLLLIDEGCGRFYGAFEFEPARMTQFAISDVAAHVNRKGMWGMANERRSSHVDFSFP
jgi:micrococcal nuclease